MNPQRHANWNLFRLEWSKIRLAWLACLSIYLIGLDGVWRNRLHIPGFTAGQDVWYSFVSFYRNTSDSAHFVVPFVIVVVTLAVLQKQTGLYYVMTRPLSRRYFFWAHYGLGILQTVMIPIIGTALAYLALCAIFYHSYGWVGGLGTTHPAPLWYRWDWEMQMRQQALDLLGKTSVPKLVLEQIVSGIALFTIAYCAIMATGKSWAGFVVLMAMLLLGTRSPDLENHTRFLQWLTPPHLCLAVVVMSAVVLGAGMSFERRDI